MAATQAKGSLAERCLAALERLACHAVALAVDVVATATRQRPGSSLLTRLAVAIVCGSMVVSPVVYLTAALLHPRLLSRLGDLLSTMLLLFWQFHLWAVLCGPRIALRLLLLLLLLV